MNTLRIRKGGKLVESHWVYSKLQDKGSYVTVDLNGNEELQYLMSDCRLDDDVTLRDILLILDRNIDIYEVILGNWVRELVNEGLNKESKKTKDIDFLELYWSFEETLFEGKSSFSGHNFPNFHGWGTWQTEIEEQKKGGIAIELTPVNELVDLPLKLKHSTEIYQRNLDFRYDASLEEIEKSERPPININECEYTLFHILYGIVWELSFAGSPEDRDSRLSDLQDMVKQLEK